MNKNEKVSKKLHIFGKTGGPQPTSLDPKSIDHFFIRNFAKTWCMTQGFQPNFKRYENGRIYFDVITDPRFTGDGFFLSMFIASEYKMHVDLLKDATHFQAEQFLAKDIIGFLLSSDERDKLPEFTARMNKSLSELNSSRDALHVGPIR